MSLPFSNISFSKPLDVLWHLLSSQPQVSDLPKTQPVIEGVPDEPSSLFALLIGINKYKSDLIHDLGGAVPDLEAMKQYLETSLGVPSSRIKTLRNEEATREAIINNLRALKTTDEIKSKNPILIFYAGHGGTAKTPDGWKATGPKIQLIVPYDADSLEGGNGKISGIPGRTIATLLKEIAQTKGDNITVICDCCHSASTTRGRVMRGVNVLMEVSSTLDCEIWGGGRGTDIPLDSLMDGLKSHVLLAACGAGELAYEEVYDGLMRGCFSKRLLETLATVGADQITYSELIQRIPCMVNQNPQCPSPNRDRICFRSKALSQRRPLYLVRKADGHYVLEGGAAHGITSGAKFAVYGARDFISTGEPLATMIAFKPRAFSSVLLASPKGPQLDTEKAYAVQVSAGREEDLRIHVEMDDRLMGVFEALVKYMEDTNPLHPKIKLVEKEMAEFSIAFEHDKIVFHILDPVVIKYGLARISHHIVPRNAAIPTVDEVHPVIRAAAHYFWHLRRAGNAESLQHTVEIEFTRLKRVQQMQEGRYVTIWESFGPNLINEGVVDIVVDTTSVYGIKITSKFDKPLYPSLFFFDSSDMTITSYFEPPVASGNKVDPPLSPNGSVAIGYGAGGARPFKYILSQGQTVDVGFLKLFLSTEPIDLSSIPQCAPFKPEMPVGRTSSRLEEKPSERWHTLLLTVVQRRATFH